MKTFSFLFLLGFLITTTPVQAQEVPPRPEPARFVNDFANLLLAGEMGALETKLRNYQDSTSTQIAIVIIPSLNGQDIESYSVQLAQTWGIGQADKDNGLLILMVLEDRKVRIEVGYGLEGRLPDLAAKHIIDSILIPNFRAQNYFQGFDEATTRIFDYLSGAYTVDEPFSKESNIFRIFMIILGGLLIIIILSYLLSWHGASEKKKAILSKFFFFVKITTIVVLFVFIITACYFILTQGLSNNPLGPFILPLLNLAIIILVFLMVSSLSGGGGTYSNSNRSWGGEGNSGGSYGGSSYSDSSSFGGGDFGGGGASGDW